MLHKTRGIVLNFVRYRESSIIVKIYTLDFGLKSYIVNGVRSRSAKTNRIALYQPLTFLDLVVYNRENADINRISEARVSVPLHSVSSDRSKSAIAIFLTELLIKTLKEEEGNPSLFTFLEESFLFFEQAGQSFANFHLQFLLKLPSYLGFGLSSHRDLLREFPELQVEEAGFWEVFDQLLLQDYSGAPVVSLAHRRELLRILLRFYPFHIEHFGELKSLDILREIQ